MYRKRRSDGVRARACRPGVDCHWDCGFVAMSLRCLGLGVFGWRCVEAEAGGGNVEGVCVWGRGLQQPGSLKLKSKKTPDLDSSR